MENLLTKQDLSLFSWDQLDSLAADIRDQIIHVLSINGGHLASNLGIVELTIALHKVFDSPKDHFLFDTGHQTYTHKILTGRAPLFSTLRRYQGLSGFSDPSESLHDPFFSGHAGNSFSLALGMAQSRDLAGKEEHIIPILGDASFTCGLTLEALNHVSKDLSRFVLVLNDNKMAISQNVGNIKNILGRFLQGSSLSKVEQELPTYRPFLEKKWVATIKNLRAPSLFFEEFGLVYIGPIDGHDIKTLCETFQVLQNLPYPVMVHVMTTKGKGMPIATKHPTPYHGVKSFDIDSGKINATSQMTFPQIFGNYLHLLGQKNPSLVTLSPAMIEGSHLTEFFKNFPERSFDTGIAEGHCVTFAGGLSFHKHFRTVVCIYSTFLQRALDNVFHDVCLQKFPVIFAIDRAGLNGPDGVTHHGIYDLGFLLSMPNLIIAQPRNGQILQRLMLSALNWSAPVAIRYPNRATEEALEPTQTIELGKGEVIVQGKKLLIITLGDMHETALKILSNLSAYDIHPSIVDPIFLHPLDEDLLIEQVALHDFIVTLEEHSVLFGMGTLLQNFLLTKDLLVGKKILTCGIERTFVQHGSVEELKRDLKLDPQSLTERILKKFYPEKI